MFKYWNWYAIVTNSFRNSKFVIKYVHHTSVTSRKFGLKYNNSEPELWVNYLHMLMDYLYAYGLILCLCTLMPTCLLTHVVSYPTPDINYPWSNYYLPGLYHMLSTDYYFSTDNFTDIQSSDIPRPRHSLEYIICSTSCILASLNINLDSLLAHSLLSA